MSIGDAAASLERQIWLDCTSDTLLINSKELERQPSAAKSMTSCWCWVRFRVRVWLLKAYASSAAACDVLDAIDEDLEPSASPPLEEERRAIRAQAVILLQNMEQAQFRIESGLSLLISLYN